MLIVFNINKRKYEFSVKPFNLKDLVMAVVCF